MVREAAWRETSGPAARLVVALRVAGALAFVHGIAVVNAALSRDEVFGRLVASEGARWLEDVTEAVGGMSVLVAAILWLVWFYDTYENAARLGPVRHRAWSVFAWLIPFVICVLPKRLVNDAWDAGGPPTRAEAGNGLLRAWWALFVGSYVLEWAAGLVGWSAGPFDGFGPPVTQRVLLALSAFAMAAAAPLAVAVVRRLTARLEQRARLAGGAGPVGAAVPA